VKCEAYMLHISLNSSNCNNY